MCSSANDLPLMCFLGTIKGMNSAYRRWFDLSNLSICSQRGRRWQLFPTLHYFVDNCAGRSCFCVVLRASKSLSEGEVYLKKLEHGICIMNCYILHCKCCYYSSIVGRTFCTKTSHLHFAHISKIMMYLGPRTISKHLPTKTYMAYR